MPRRSTASSVDDGGLGGLQRLEIWTGKSQAPERIGILLRLWSLLLRRQGLGLARACSMFSRVLFSFLSPFPLNCLRVCGLSLPLFLSPSLSHHLSLPPSMRGSGRVGRWRGGVRGEIHLSPSFWYTTAHGTFFLSFSLKCDIFW